MKSYSTVTFHRYWANLTYRVKSDVLGRLTAGYSFARSYTNNHLDTSYSSHSPSSTACRPGFAVFNVAEVRPRDAQLIRHFLNGHRTLHSHLIRQRAWRTLLIFPLPPLIYLSYSTTCRSSLYVIVSYLYIDILGIALQLLELIFCLGRAASRKHRVHRSFAPGSKNSVSCVMVMNQGHG